jgi:hypothetical protein
LALGTLLVSSPARAETAREVIQKAVEAHGGLDNLKKLAATRSTFKGTMTVMDVPLSFEGETVTQMPSREKTVMKLDVLGKKVNVVQVVNGDKAQVSTEGMKAPLSDAQKEEMRESVVLGSVYHLAPLLDENAYELRLLDKADKVMGQEVVGVRVKPKKGREVRLYFDKDSHRLLKVARKGLDTASKVVDQETFFSDFKKADGALVPMKMETHMDGKKSHTLEFDSVKPLDKVDEKEFDISD